MTTPLASTRFRVETERGRARSRRTFYAANICPVFVVRGCLIITDDTAVLNRLNCARTMRIKTFTDTACSLTIFWRCGKFDPGQSARLDILNVQSALRAFFYLQIFYFDRIENLMQVPVFLLKVSDVISDNDGIQRFSIYHLKYDLKILSFHWVNEVLRLPMTRLV